MLLAPVSLIDINLGFIGLKAFAAAVLGGFGSIPGALVGGITIGLIELFAGAYLPHGFKDVGRLRRAARRARRPAAGHVRHRGPEEGLTRMRFVFKTSYGQDLGLFRDSVQRNWYLALLVGAARAAAASCPNYLGDISLVFIYGLCGLSLMVLAGYTGLVSLGHAAFLGIGAYTHVYFAQDLGLPWVVAVALAAVRVAAPSA